ncbi:hypothetical protein WN944_010913 [Citrus x changshan-huyou]|uniref:Uncharacterized protein n=1 Tax=Citrus x changshan-huyou TaxID=2935761 RepID=A0AAP0QXI6_9ROSI
MFNAIVKDTATVLEGPACASIVAPRQTSDNIQGPSASKNLVKRKRMEGSSDAAWVGVKGKKIITAAGIDPREDYEEMSIKLKRS